MIKLFKIRTFNIFLLLLLSASVFLFNCKGKAEDEPEPEEPEEIIIPTNTPAVERWGQLSVEGNRIVGKDGNPVVLRGMSFFWSQWPEGSKYYNKDVVKWLRDDWRCTVIRAAMAVDQIHGGYTTSPTIAEREKAKIIEVIDAAIDNGLYVIIDWHSHEAEETVEDAKAFFAEMAQTYGHYPNIIYETYNEPINQDWSTVIKPYHEAVIDTIRHYDQNNIIVCGTGRWAQDVDIAADDPIMGRKHIAYTLHYYATTHGRFLRGKANYALNKGLALMVTEYGTCEANGDGFLDKEESQIWWDWMDSHRISHCNWSVSDKNETASALVRNANSLGGWTEEEISPSGKFVREHLKSKNPAPAE
ncbi:MAG: glycoside hydrolase family 5 protein [Cytophagaceae bacterium]